MSYYALRVSLCILLPVFASVLSYMRPRWRKAVVFLTTLLVAGTVLSLLPASLARGGTVVYTSLAPGLPLTLHLDPLTILFALVSSLLWVPASLYALYYMADDGHQGRFFAYYLLSLGVTMGIAFAGSLLTLYLFYELLTLVTYPLVVHSGGEAADEAGKAYIVYSLFGATLILVGLMVTSSIAPTTTFGSSGLLSSAHNPQTLKLVAYTFVFGFGVKAAIVPFHRWLPLAMAAPTPVSALLHAVAVVNAGSYGIMRVLYTVFGHNLVASLGLRPTLVTLACVTIIFGSVWALGEDSLKRRLAYSTVSQMGYLLLGSVLLVPFGLKATMLHFVNHALLKIALFFSAGALYHSYGITRVDEVRGLGPRYPLVFGAFLLSSLGLIGVVPLNGFLSKWFYLQGALQSNYIVVVGVLAVSSLLNALYYLPILMKAFFESVDDNYDPSKEHRSLYLELPGFVLACTSLLLGVFPHYLLGLIEKATALIW